ncbi:MAG TPA: LCP family protein, partial [Actinomycetota bacterium]|nr:LCP family protein [Actinomycetota bacterium]
AIGSDARPGVCMPVDRCLADSVHLLAINTEERSATIVGFPRDSYVEVPGHGSERINEALREGGPELLVDTVERVTGVRVDAYLLTSFEGFIGMIDALGGITVEIPYPMHDASARTNFEPGPRRLDGLRALRFARDRKSGPNGDFSRSANHGTLMTAALRALQRDVQQDPADLFEWIVTGIRNLQTDLSFTEIFDLMVTALSIDKDRVANVVVPGGLGFVGSASIVTLGNDAEVLFRDLRDDGLLKASRR